MPIPTGHAWGRAPRYYICQCWPGNVLEVLSVTIEDAAHVRGQMIYSEVEPGAAGCRYTLSKDELQRRLEAESPHGVTADVQTDRPPFC